MFAPVNRIARIARVWYPTNTGSGLYNPVILWVLLRLISFPVACAAFLYDNYGRNVSTFRSFLLTPWSPIFIGVADRYEFRRLDFVVIVLGLSQLAFLFLYVTFAWVA